MKVVERSCWCGSSALSLCCAAVQHFIIIVTYSAVGGIQQIPAQTVHPKMIGTEHMPVKGGRCLWLPLHVRSVEVHIVKPPSYPVFPVPLKAVYQRPGGVSNHVHSIYDDCWITNTTAQMTHI